MIIALDYDDTFTKDPDAWCHAMRVLKQAGRRIIGVTMRYPEEASGMSSRYVELCERIYFTGRQEKGRFMRMQGIRVDVWIDDSPHWVERDAAR